MKVKHFPRVKPLHDKGFRFAPVTKPLQTKGLVRMLDDGSYEAIVVDVDTDDARDNVVRIELTITAGARKGDVVSVRAVGITRDAIDLLGVPATLFVENGRPRITFD